MSLSPTRRRVLSAGAAVACGFSLYQHSWMRAAESTTFRLAVFQADVTPRLGMPVYTGGFNTASAIDDPLLAKGLVLLGGTGPVVIVAVDWCEIRNRSFDRWKESLADAAGTSPDHVLVSSLHQHDAPLGEIEAQRILEQHRIAGRVVDLDFHEQCIARVAAALKESLAKAQNVTHYGLGQAKVDSVASSRRVVWPDGRVNFGRYSKTTDPALQGLPDGDIDPYLKTISFYHGDRPLAALSVYATHPMSYYGSGRVSCEFVGLARERRAKDDPTVHQIYASGCSGDVTAGKYNDGQTENRSRLADRIYAAMVAAWKATEKHPLTKLELRTAPLVLPYREGPGLSAADQEKILADDAAPFARRATAAMLLSSLRHNPRGHVCDLAALDLGRAQIALLPAESFVAYQLLAQKLRPDQMIFTLGYGQCSPGYIPTRDAEREGFVAEHGYTYAAPTSPTLIEIALRTTLAAPAK